MKLRILLLVLLLCAVAFSGVALAQTPTPTPPSLPPMPPIIDVMPPAPLVDLTLYKITVQVDNQVATTRIEQTFFNPGPQPVEASYFFPIPQDAAISDFSMVVDGQTVEGQIMPKDKARAIYEDIVRQRRDPALLEYVGRDLVQARIFPIPAGGNRTIKLSYSQVLPQADGLTHYRFPLRTYPLLVEGASPRFVQPIRQLAITVDLRSATPLKAIYSSSHPVDVLRAGETEATIGYEASGVTPSSDFDLYWSADAGDVAVNLLSYKPAGEDGYFLLLAAPKVTLDAGQVVSRDVFLVLDTSGSMEGEKIAQARQALDAMIRRLNPQDRFNVISFSTGVRQYAAGLQPSSQAAQAGEFIASLQAEGSTDINRALLETLAQAAPDRPTVVVFVTDGLPTVGETDPQRIIDNVRRAISPNVQIFSFGVGYDVDTVLLDTISQENRGASSYVQPGQAIDEVVSAFYQKISTPVLANLKLELAGAQVEDLYPYPLPDLFAGGQLILAGRYRNGGPTQVTLEGTVNGQSKRYTFDDLRLNESGGEPFIARLWATRKIGYLLNQIRLQGANQELIDEIVRLSTTYGIVTPYTSFFVPEPVTVVDANGMPLPTMVPAPQAVVEVEKQVGSQAAPSLSAASQAPASGAGAVQESVAREELRSADQAASGGAEQGVRTAGDKTFVYQAGLWVDTAYRDGMTRQTLDFGSQAYFDLLQAHPEWAGYLAVSPNLIVALNNVAYVITDTGASIEPAAGTPSPTGGPIATLVTSATITATVAPQPSPVVTSTAPAPTVAPTPAPTREPGSGGSLCSAPAFAVGLVLLPGAWAARRRGKGNGNW